jgi:hypothetical protein
VQSQHETNATTHGQRPFLHKEAAGGLVQAASKRERNEIRRHKRHHLKQGPCGQRRGAYWSYRYLNQNGLAGLFRKTVRVCRQRSNLSIHCKQVVRWESWRVFSGDRTAHVRSSVDAGWVERSEAHRAPCRWASHSSTHPTCFSGDSLTDRTIINTLRCWSIRPRFPAKRPRPARGARD